MFLILLIKIIFLILIIRYSIRWVSYHINHKNKKAKVFHGNTRMPFHVEFALMYGINAKTKTRFKIKDLSYRKNLVEWMCILNSLYPPDNLNFTRPSRINANSVDRKRKTFPFPKIKTGNNNFIPIKKICNVFTAKLCAKNNGVVSSFLFSTKIAGINNLKIPQNPIPFPKQTFACTHPIFMVCFNFYSLSFSFFLPSSNHQIIKTCPTTGGLSNFFPFSNSQILKLTCQV